MKITKQFKKGKWANAKLLLGIVLIVAMSTNIIANASVASPEPGLLAQQDNVITFTPSKTVVTEGESFDVVVSLETEVLIPGIEFDVAYDATVLRLDSKASITSILDLYPSTVFITKVLMTAGFEGEAQGDGDLLTLKFTVLDDSKSTEISLTGLHVTDENDNILEYDIVPAKVNELGPTRVTFYLNYSLTDDSQYDPGNLPNENKLLGETLSEPTAPSRTGYNFAGWYTARADGSVWNFASDKLESRSLNLYARWAPRTDIVVTFDKNYIGTPVPDPASKTVTFGATYGTLATITRTGYTFDGWNLEEDGPGTPVTADSIVNNAANHTLYARWSPRSDIVVTFDKNTSVTPDPDVTWSNFTSKEVAFDAGYGVLATISRVGYEFGGWFHDAVGTGTVVTPATIVNNAENHTLYAKWIPKSDIMVTFNKYTTDPEATDPVPDSIQVEYDAPYGVLATISRVGYDFAGWYLEPEYINLITAASIVKKAENHMLYAKWIPRSDFVVTFNKNTTDTGASEPSFPSKTVTFDEPYGELASITRSGYTFGGWYLDEEGNGTPITADSIVKSVESHTLYARWIPITGIVVTFDKNYTGTPVPDPATKEVTFGTAYGTLATITRTGYTFDGWNLEEDGPGTPVTADSIVNNVESHTLYARWIPISGIVVTFDKNYIGTPVPEPETKEVTFGTAYGTLATISRTGYTFDGWNLEEEGTGTPVTADSIVNNAENHTLYARWTPTTDIVVTFDKNYEGTPVPDPATKVVTFGAAYGTLATISRYGYTFGGWYLNRDGTGTPVSEDSIVNNEANHTLYASWIPISGIVVSYNEDPGLSLPEPKEVTFGEPYGPLATVTRTGYVFVGWYLDASGTGDVVTATTIVSIAENHTLYARWDLDPAVQDNADITAAKALIEATTFSTAQENAGNAAQARAVVVTIIGGLDLKGVVAEVEGVGFTPAVPGNASNPAGTDGSYKFTVKLNKGVGTQQTTTEMTLRIIASARLTATVTVTAPGNVVYGTTLGDPSAVADAGGSNFTFTYSGTPYDDSAPLVDSLTKPIKAGEYTVKAELISDTHIGSGSAVFTISRKSLSVEAIAISKVYGDTITPLTANYIEFAYGDTVSMLPIPIVIGVDATATSPVGSYEMYIVSGFGNNGNYYVTFTTNILTISKKPITVSAENKLRFVGEPNPALTFSFNASDLVGGDTVDALAVTLSCAANVTSPAGSYPITGTHASLNYEVTVVQGTLTVNPVPAETYTVIVQASTGGTATGGASNIAAGSDITVTATPASGYEFDGWYENGVKVSSVVGYRFEVNANRTLEARFKKIPDIEPGTPIFVDGDGNALEGLTSSTLTTNYVYENETSSTMVLTMYVAVFAPNGSMVYIDTVTETVAAGEQSEFVVTLNLPGNEDGSYAAKGYYANVFMWDENFMPVTVSYRFG